ncbi:unnamed protein product [Toxocara canis]|uniref:DDE Tnp4 domain-containing protein n=1 Tax=Toxocara canis TaxID=6265 RepID=A0A183V360_TOXCA|nr:unnamed protein product [Toxocara canis]
MNCEFQLALTTSHRPSAASVLISLAPREERSSYRRYGENLTVGDAGFPPIEKKSPTSEGVCSLRAERFPYAHISTQGVIPANDDEESRIEQIFISVPTTNRPISRSVSMQRGHREKRRSSNLGIFCSPRNSVELERQFQVSQRLWCTFKA